MLDFYLISNGLRLDSYCISIECLLDLYWISLGFLLNFYWNSIGFLLEFDWIPIGFLLGFSWTSLGVLLDFYGIHIGCSLDSSWFVFDVSIGYLLISFCALLGNHCLGGSLLKAYAKSGVPAVPIKSRFLGNDCLWDHCCAIVVQIQVKSRQAVRAKREKNFLGPARSAEKNWYDESWVPRLTTTTDLPKSGWKPRLQPC